MRKTYRKRMAAWTLWGCTCLWVLTGCAHRSNENPIPPTPTAATTSASQPASPQATPSPVPTPTADPMQAKLAKMSLDEKIGQMILAGIDGYTMTPEAHKLLESYHVGGIILYKPNVKSSAQLVELTNALKKANNVNQLPLWIGADEEGGRVTRLPDEIIKTPTNQEIGKTGNAAFAFNVGSLLGKELHAYGLNVDFAPVLDVNSNPNNPVIGDRSFGANATVVTSMGVQAMKGLQAQHVTPVVKHFPGHGDTSVDSHVGLPVVQNDLTRLRKLELVSFTEAIKQDADAVMVAHILLPKVDPQNPATMSKKIMTDLLRQELGFQGVVITDDMTMGAITQNYNLADSAVKSVVAGANVILVGHEYDKIVAVTEALRQAVQDKRIPLETIDQSVMRIMKLKQKYELKDQAVQTPDVSVFNNTVHQLLSTYLHK
ncbi:beta-N-acetylhexosaminidase [Paenibacillus aestuarii]|uniref:beta-N-acetylhexosaminidase n=1 Tax=Paenibacillus aestuarii TaxID=516965 RepID=A0ABW0K1S2_9BACL|nr:beta-N-acetylhexosaminidase [Paenibacillus aestuarii]